MDRLEHADQVLRDAHRRQPAVVIPTSAGSPMDDRLTLRLSQDFIDSCDPERSGAPDMPQETPPTGRRSSPAAEPAVGYLDEETLAMLDKEAAIEAELARLAGRESGPARFRRSG